MPYPILSDEERHKETPDAKDNNHYPMPHPVAPGTGQGGEGDRGTPATGDDGTRGSGHGSSGG